MYGTCTDHFTHLGNLFVVIDNTELSNKVVLCMIDQKGFVIKTFYSCVDSCVAVQREYYREFSVSVAPLRDTLYWFVK
jgi:hypothetical protein